MMRHFTFGHYHVPGIDRFYLQNKEKSPPSIRYYKKKNFDPKLLMWLAISEEGHCDPFFVPGKGNINGNVYRQECIMRHLIPFLQQHNAYNNYVFWPDLASSHYAKDTIALFNKKKYSFFCKRWQSSKCAATSSSWKLMGILKSRVYDGDWKAKTDHQQIKKCLHKLDWNVVWNMSSFKTKMKKATDTSPRLLL